MANYDDMSFGKAFAAARRQLGAGKTFTWKGKTYSTNQAGEKKAAPASSAPTTSQRPESRPNWMSTPGGRTRMGMSTPEGRRSDASRVSTEAPPKPVTPKTSQRPMPRPSAAPATSQRPMPRPAAASATPRPAAGTPTPAPRSGMAPATSQRPMPRPAATPAAASRPATMPTRPISRTPGAKPAGEGKKLTHESAAYIARNAKPKK